MIISLSHFTYKRRLSPKNAPAGRLLDAGIDEDGKLEAATVTSEQLVQVCCLSRGHRKITDVKPTTFPKWCKS